MTCVKTAYPSQLRVQSGSFTPFPYSHPLRMTNRRGIEKGEGESKRLFMTLQRVKAFRQIGELLRLLLTQLALELRAHTVLTQAQK